MAAAPGIPFDIPGYRIVRQLGQGGMATVYLATQTALGRQVAVKVLAAERTPSEELIKRFENETRTIARLDHPHIVSIYEVGRASTGQLYYTMPFLPNGDLSRKRFGDDGHAVVAVLRALGQALAYAHEQGIVHRDVKPENVLYDKLDRPLLADFGIALHTHNDIRVTREGATLGSTGYMSPEQARGQAIDGRSDLYSLGVMAFELLTGDLPFHGPDALAVALAHVEQPVPRLPPNRRVWQDLIDRTLAKEPANRFQDAGAFLAALDDIERTLSGTKAATTDWRATMARLRPTLPAGAWVGIAALAGTLLLLALLLQPRDPAELAETPTQPAGVSSGVRSTAPLARSAAAAESAASPLLETSEIDRLLTEGAARLKERKLVAPSGDNAAESYLAILTLYPDHSEALAGIGNVYTAMSRDIAAALQRNDADAARGSYEQARMLADQALLYGKPNWKAFTDAVGTTITQRIDTALRQFDAAALETLQPLVDTFVVEAPELRERLTAARASLAAMPTVGSTVQDENGPALVVVAPVGSDRSFAIQRTEVSRSQYAAFARATGRVEAKCREPMSPWSRLRKLSWRDPGYPQNDDHPVACVSWQDAYAYAKWLGQRSGARYRLPTESEWLHAARGIGDGSACANGDIADESKGGVSLRSRYKCSDGHAYTAPVGSYRANQVGVQDMLGNVSEWTMSCSNGAPFERLLDSDACPERIFRGSAWRDGPDAGALERRGAADPDVGYTTVGFRVLRELSLDNVPKVTAR